METVYRTLTSFSDTARMIAEKLADAKVTTYHNAIALSVGVIIFSLVQRTWILRRRG